jgi:hypothetical protein
LFQYIYNCLAQSISFRDWIEIELIVSLLQWSTISCNSHKQMMSHFEGTHTQRTGQWPSGKLSKGAGCRRGLTPLRAARNLRKRLLMKAGSWRANI